MAAWQEPGSEIALPLVYILGERLDDEDEGSADEPVSAATRGRASE
jgi:hypothetical protein